MDLSTSTTTTNPPRRICVITLGADENRFDPERVSRFNALLNVVEDDPDAALLVIRGKGKFFSNGHNVKYLEDSVAKDGGKALPWGGASVFLKVYYRLLARLTTFPIPTVALINGHAFAGGCLLAMACDYRVMRSDKGFICMNEIDMALLPPPPPGTPESVVKPGMFPGVDRKMTLVMRSKLPALLVRDMFLKGTRYDAKEALRAGIVDHVAEVVISSGAGEAEIETALLSKTIELFAKTLAPKTTPKNRRTIAVLKHELVRETVEALTDGDGVAAFRSGL